MELILISGLSGAGKSRAGTCLEDIGYFVADNMPAPLIPKFAELVKDGSFRYSKVAVVVDVRGGKSFEDLFAAIDALEEMGVGYKILFLEASGDTIIKRFKETRRLHPLAKDCRSLAEAVEKEGAILRPIRERATSIIDTTALSTAKLRGEILSLYGSGEPQQAMRISVVSFGFKYGIPIEADLVFDVRFLPNPYYVHELRDQTGLDKPVYDYVMDHPQTREFIDHLENMVGFLLPQYVQEGKTALVIGVGCTGGQHRSVAVVWALAEFIRRCGFEATEIHRDMTRKMEWKA